MPDLPAPGFQRHPGFKSELTPAPKRLVARYLGRVIAESDNVLTLKEGDYPPVHYFPREDVRMTALTRTTHRTHCPFKGDASYWSVGTGDETAENAVWSYEDPFREAASLKDRLAFYANIVHVSEDG